MKKGFTLAEVLITLGIIGIVASMTLPAIVQKYDEQANLVRLKRTFNVLSNALVAARAENGDPNNWTFEGAEEEYNPDAARNTLDTCINKYILPYLAKGYTFRHLTTLSDAGYKTSIYKANGTEYKKLNNQYSILRLNDGTHVIFGYSGHAGSGIGSSDKDTSYLGAISFVIDVNGPKLPNRLGKDIFICKFPLLGNASLIFNQRFEFRYVGSTFNGYRILTESRDELFENCKTVGEYCGALIQYDSWQIKDDYPW